MWRAQGALRARELRPEFGLGRVLKNSDLGRDMGASALEGMRADRIFGGGRLVHACRRQEQAGSVAPQLACDCTAKC